MTSDYGVAYPYDEHPLQGAAQQSRTDRDASLDALHRLEAALAAPVSHRPMSWVDGVHDALLVLCDALEIQVGGDAENASLLSEIAAEEPRLVPRIDRLRRQHRDLRASVQAVLDEVGSGSRNDVDSADIRERVAEIARRLRHHRAQEADLIYEAVNINLGAGD
jgi:hypothetical protein